MGCDFTLHVGNVPVKKLTEIETEIDLEEAYRQPHIIVAECSFLKAGLLGDPDYFIPYIVRRLSDLIPSGSYAKTRVIDNQLIEEVEKAWELHEKYNKSPYEVYVTKEELLNFLREHKGKPVYYICW